MAGRRTEHCAAIKILADFLLDETKSFGVGISY
jgi:hypothetical protein